MNVELLRKVQDAIREEPRKINMEWWAGPCSDKDPYRPPCGTTGCIYGWGKSITTGLLGKALQEAVVAFDESPTAAGAKFFDIDVDQAIRLFYPEEWPLDLMNALDFRNTQTPEYAAIVCDRIDRFIDTGGAE